MSEIALRDISKTFFPEKDADIFLKFYGLSNPFLSFADPKFVVEEIQKEVEESNGQDGKLFAIKGLNLDIPEGKVVVVLGPSGCGKSTLLRLIAGLDKPDSGDVLFDGKLVNEMHPKDRKIGMVFQNYALYPAMNVRKNILSFFEFHRKSDEMKILKEEKFQKTSELLGIDIKYLLDRKVNKLSGGERQRVALGRCISRDPSVLLLDEPFSNLDAQLRERYRIQLKKLLIHLKITTVYVTHDQQEAMVLGDRIVVMREGRIVQAGAFHDIYHHPDNLFVAGFINPNLGAIAINEIEGGLIQDKWTEKTAGIRPQDIMIAKEAVNGSYPALIRSVSFQPAGNQQLVLLAAFGKELSAVIPADGQLKEGMNVFIQFSKVHLFDAATGLAEN